MSGFFVGFTDELIKLAGDPLAGLDKHMEGLGLGGRQKPKPKLRTRTIQPPAPPAPGQPKLKPAQIIKKKLGTSAEEKRLAAKTFQPKKITDPRKQQAWLKKQRAEMQGQDRAAAQQAAAEKARREEAIRRMYETR